MFVRPSAMPSFVASVRWVTLAFCSTASSSCRSRCASISIMGSRPGRSQLPDNRRRYPFGGSSVCEFALVGDDAPAAVAVLRGVVEVTVDQIDEIAARLRNADRPAAHDLLKMR